MKKTDKVLWNKYFEGYLHSGDNQDADKAIKYYKKILKIRLEELGKEHLDTAIIYLILGDAYYWKKDANKAINYYKKAFKIYDKTLGRYHFDTKNIHGKLKSSYSLKEYYERNIKFDKNRLKGTLEKYPHQSSMAYNKLAVAYKNHWNLKKAIDCYKKELEITIETKGKDHSDTADIYNNLGVAYRDKGENDTAIEYFNKCLKIWLKTFGEDEVSYSSVGLAHRYKGDYEKAIYYFEKNRIQKDEFAYSKYDSKELGIAYDLNGEYVRAINCFKRVLDIEITYYSNFTGDEFYNLGVSYKKRGDFEIAITYFEKAISYYHYKLGQNHFYTQNAYNNLGLTYYELFSEKG